MGQSAGGYLTSPGTPCIKNDKVREPNGSRTIVPNHLFSDMLYRDLTLSVGTQRAMPEAQSTWTKRVGAEPNQQNKHSNEVPEPKTEKMAMYT